MKTIKMTAILMALLAPTYFFGQSADTATQTEKTQKFEVTIIQAAGPDENKLGVSITEHHDIYQYTFEWKVDGKPAGNQPIAKANDGQKVELVVTRYPGGDQSTVSLQLEIIETSLPLFPKKDAANGMLASN